MKRSTGLTLVGILILVLSALMLMGAVLGGVFMLNAPMPAQTIPNAPPPEQMRAMSILGIGFLGLMAAFGVAIGVGILRLWAWARYTAIVIGFLVAGICTISALAIFVMPMPETSGTPPGFAGGFRIGMSIFYLFWAALYASVSIYLLRASVGEQFRRAGMSAGAAIEQNEKPIAVLIVAGLMLMLVLGLPYIFFMHVPLLIFGVEVGGTAGKVAMLVWFLLFVVIGIGLILRVRDALWAAVGLYGTGILNVLLGFRHGAFERYYARLPHYGLYDPLSGGMFRIVMLMSLVFSIIPIALLLIGKRTYFAWCDRKQLAVAPPQV